MSAEAVQQIRTGFQRRKEVQPAVGPARALSHAVLQMNHEAGAGVLLAQAGGDNSHHPLVPVLTGEDQGAPLLRPEFFDFSCGIGADGLLHCLTLPVQIA